MHSGVINIALKQVPYNFRFEAMDKIEHFAKQYPDRVGVRNGCAYQMGADCIIYVYRTKTGALIGKASQ